MADCPDAAVLRFVLPWGIPLKLPRPESAPLAAAADTVQELGELPLLPFCQQNI